KEAQEEPSQQEKKPVKVNGVEFQVVSQPVWKIPERGGSTPIKLGLQFTNDDREKKVYFYLFDTVFVNMRPQGGEWIQMEGGRNVFPRRNTLSHVLGRCQSYTFSYPDAKLRWVRDELRLVLVDQPSEYHCFPGLAPGKYEVVISYRNESDL